MNFGALRGLNDPLSVYNEAIYSFYRTLKRWTTEVYGGVLRGVCIDASWVCYGVCYACKYGLLDQ